MSEKIKKDSRDTPSQNVSEFRFTDNIEPKLEYLKALYEEENERQTIIEGKAHNWQGRQVLFFLS